MGFKILKLHSGLKRPQSAILILTIWGFLKCFQCTVYMHSSFSPPRKVTAMGWIKHTTLPLVLSSATSHIKSKVTLMDHILIDASKENAVLSVCLLLLIILYRNKCADAVRFCKVAIRTNFYSKRLLHLPLYMKQKWRKIWLKLEETNILFWIRSFTY